MFSLTKASLLFAKLSAELLPQKNFNHLCYLCVLSRYRNIYKLRLRWYVLTVN